MVEIFYVLLPQRNSLEVLKNRSMEVPLYHKGKKKKSVFHPHAHVLPELEQQELSSP